MACKCGTERKPDSPESFLIYQSDIWGVVRSGPERLLQKEDKVKLTFTDNAASFAPRNLTPIDGFNTDDFCRNDDKHSWIYSQYPGDALVIAIYNAIISTKWRKYCRCKTQCEPPQVQGGQCFCVEYLVFCKYWRADGVLLDGNVLNIVKGPVKYEVRTSPTPGYQQWGLSCTSGTDCHADFFVMVDAPAGSVYFTDFRCFRRDGLPDLCGDLATYEPPYFPDLTFPDYGEDFTPVAVDTPVITPIPFPDVPPVFVPIPFPITLPDVLYVPPTVAPPVPPIVAPNPAPPGCNCPPPALPIREPQMIQGPPGPPGLPGIPGTNGDDAVVRFVDVTIPVTVPTTDGAPVVDSVSVKVVANDDGESEADFATHLLNEIVALRTEGVSVSKGVAEPVLLFSASVSASNPVVISTPIPTYVRSIIVKVSGSLGSSPRKFVLAGDETEYLLGHLSFWSDGAMLLPRYEMSTMKSMLPVPHSAVPLRVRFSARFNGTFELYDSGERWNQPINQ